MSSWNPARKARNFLARMRELTDGVVTIRHEVGQLRATTDALRAETEALREQTLETQRIAEQVHLETDSIHSFSGRAARRATLQGNRIRVVFLVHNRHAWDSVGEVISIMRHSEDFDPIVITIPHHYGGGSEPHGERRTHRFLSELGVPHLRLRSVAASSPR